MTPEPHHGRKRKRKVSQRDTAEDELGGFVEWVSSLEKIDSDTEQELGDFVDWVSSFPKEDPTPEEEDFLDWTSQIPIQDEMRGRQVGDKHNDSLALEQLDESIRLLDINEKRLKVSHKNGNSSDVESDDGNNEISEESDGDEYTLPTATKTVPQALPDLPSPPPSGNNSDYRSAHEIKTKIMSSFDIWMPALTHHNSLAPGTWVDYSILNFILLQHYYDNYPEICAGYLDTSCLDLSNVDNSVLWRVKQFGIPRFRRRYFLPDDGPCPLQPKVFIIHENGNHFFSVYMDHSKRHVIVFGRTSPEQHTYGRNERDAWEDWDGPQKYQQICDLHGWSNVSTDDILVQSVTWPGNGVDCGPIAALVSCQLVSEGISDRVIDVLKKKAISCHHTTRILLFQSLKSSIMDSFQGYNFLRDNPPDEWLSFTITVSHPQYSRLSAEIIQQHQTLQSNMSPVLQKLHQHRSSCPSCMKNSRGTSSPPIFQNDDHHEENNLAHEDIPSHRQVPHQAGSTSPSPGASQDPILGPASNRDVPHSLDENQGQDDLPSVPNESSLQMSRTRRLHLIKVDWNQLCIERKRKRSQPCDLPSPSLPLWPAHDMFYDDYYGGPTREDLRAFEDPIHAFSLYDPILSSVHIKSPWTYFRDYGYRLMPRFAHAYYLCPPMLLEEHIMPLVPLFSSRENKQHFHQMHLEPRHIGRTGDSEQRTVISGDVEIVGAQEMLDRVDSEVARTNADDLILHFLKGKNKSGDYLCVDMERDALPSSKIDVDMSVDIDSFLWVGNTVKVLMPVFPMVTPSIKHNSSIKKHNHVYIEVLEPPTDHESTNPSQKSWMESRVPLVNIPHTLFCKITEGNSPIYCHIFFPRMIHRHEYTHKRQTHIPSEVLIWFWNHVVLKALFLVVCSTTQAPFHEFTVDKIGAKQPGKNSSTENLTYHGSSKVVSPEAFLLLQKKMRSILESYEDSQTLSRFKSFFFVVECHGFKLNVISDTGTAAMAKLRAYVPQMDWDYALDRKNGEMHMDVGFMYHPHRKEGDETAENKSGITGLWRLAFLEESFAKAGFKAGNVHHLNTMSGFGAIQAEMTIERSRRTHVLYRSSYNLVYEVVRKKDNKPWLCGDGDAYNLSEEFYSACASKYNQYRDLGSRSYGVRDEYRLSGSAALEVLQDTDKVMDRFLKSHGVIWIPTCLWFDFITHRLKALETSAVHLYRINPDNKGVISGLFMHLIRSIESTPREVPSHVRHTLAALTTRFITSTFGMMFLHDLNLTDAESPVIPRILQKDDNYLRMELDIGRKRKTRQFVNQPRITVEFPIGEAPTWTQVTDKLKKEPLTIIRPWEKPIWRTHIPTLAGILFVDFTRSFWLSLKSDWRESLAPEFDDSMNLDGAMEAWSAHSIVGMLTSVSFKMNRHGINGAVRGTQDAKSFRQRSEIYFPNEDINPPSEGARWWPYYVPEGGYIWKYHNHLKKMRFDEDKEALRLGIQEIFSHLQCLPDSEEHAGAGQGSTCSSCL